MSREENHVDDEDSNGEGDDNDDGDDDDYDGARMTWQNLANSPPLLTK